MAFNFKRSSKEPMSEINVTPFVDVMLVLLIVFMVTAPLLTVGIPVDLPKVKASALTDQKDPIEITVNLNNDEYQKALRNLSRKDHQYSESVDPI